jgi:hypothetical protein
MVKLRPTADGKGVPQSSFLVEIPRAKGNGYYDFEDPQEPLFANERPDRPEVPDRPYERNSYLRDGAAPSVPANPNPNAQRQRQSPGPPQNYINLADDAPAPAGTGRPAASGGR